MCLYTNQQSTIYYRGLKNAIISSLFLFKFSSVILQSSNWLGKIDGVDVAPEKSTVSVTWFIVADHLPRPVSPQSTDPDIVSWVGWVHDARTTWQQVRILPALVVLLPTYATINSQYIHYYTL